MERFWTGNKDVDRNILLSIESDRDLLNACMTNNYAKELCNDSFFHNRLISKYRETIPYKNVKSWKNYYLKVLYYIDKMKREYNFNFTTGNPELYYKILKNADEKVEDIGIEQAARHGLNDLIEHYKDFDYSWEWALLPAIESGKKSTVELILSKGVTNYNEGLYASVFKGNIELVELFLSKGADNLYESAQSAFEKGYSDILNLILEKMTKEELDLYSKKGTL